MLTATVILFTICHTQRGYILTNQILTFSIKPTIIFTFVIITYQ